MDVEGSSGSRSRAEGEIDAKGSPTLVLHTSRLILREFTENDYPALRSYHSDERYRRYYPTTSDSVESDTLDLLTRFLEWQSETPRSKYQLAITLAESGELIGNVGLRKASADAVIAETGFELAPEYWGRGFATEASLAILDFGFESLRLHRVYAHCVADNERSVRVLERIGMRREGRLREHVLLNGVWSDVLPYGILASEWQERKLL